MDGRIRIRSIEESEINQAHNLVVSVFDEFVAPSFSDEGIAEFKSFIDPPKWKERLRTNSIILVAEVDSEIVGVVGARDYSHFYMLFVSGAHQGQGIATQLIEEIFRSCVEAGHTPHKMTVNSSPNAVEAYKRMGFRLFSEEQLEKGIRFIPMVIELSERVPPNVSLERTSPRRAIIS